MNEWVNERVVDEHDTITAKFAVLLFHFNPLR